MKSLQCTAVVLYFLTIICVDCFGQKLLAPIVDSTHILCNTSIYFDSDKFNILSTEVEKLKEVSKVASSNNNATIFIQGHTDVVGDADYNLILSQERALSVKSYLVGQDSACHFADVEYFGENDPTQMGEDPKTLQANRRVEVLVLMKQKYIRLSGEVLDEDEQPLTKALVKIKTVTHEAEIVTGNQGEFTIYSPVGEDVEISVLAEDHFYRSLKVKAAKTLKLPKLKFVLPSLKFNRKFVADQLFFHGNRSILRNTSFDELARIEKTMLLSERFCFEIAGHMNGIHAPNVKRGSRSFKLSVARALTVFDSLVNAGVHGGRIFARGYGNWEMLFPKGGSKEKMQANRRVEIIVRPCDLVKSMENDFLDNRSDFGFDASKMKFRTSARELDLPLFNKDEQETILSHVKHLVSIHHDPLRYTYHQLLTKQIITENRLRQMEEGVEFPIKN